MLNLIDDAWIPVRCRDGSQRVVAPWEMALPDVVRPDWPRADLNIACYEMLIGLVYMAAPPANIEDWRARKAPDPDRLRNTLAAFAPAFNLLGDGPRFLQDLEPLAGDPNDVDMLFIDSAGASTSAKNADVMVHRDRYTQLDLPFAAMSLFAFQAFAPAGGAGNRTSMRGGGPLVTLIDPRNGQEADLWRMVWANVPYGVASTMAELPWMRATRVSDKGLETFPPDDRTFGVEAFFGMPRRLRLMEQAGRICGVVQKPWGTNYAKWMHPLSPYYRAKAGAEWWPKHPTAGRFGYRNWLGIVAEKFGNDRQSDTLSDLARCLKDWTTRRVRGEDSSVIVAGWSMDNMKPRDFTLSVQPFAVLDADGMYLLQGMIEAASQAASALRGALTPVLAEGEARDAEREAFFIQTEPRFLTQLAAIKAGENPSAAWLADLRAQALRQFDALALPAIDQRETDAIRKIVDARKFLGLAFAGLTKQGKAIFDALDLPHPEKTKGKAA